jgi:RHS repeat-associated protein
VAVQAGGGVQTTEYVYQARTATGSAINSNDILTETRYPDPTTGLSSTSERTVSTVNRLGDSITFSDQNGTVHGVAYDAVGRMTADFVTVLGSGVDGAVRRIETGYDSAGLLFRTTSLDAPSGGTVVNEVHRLYNGFGQLTQEYQDHFGPVNSSITPKVTYSYSEASGGNHSRLTTNVYPNGRTFEYEYDPGIDTAISRLSRLTGDADGGGFTSYEEYDYLGASTMVERGRPESGIKLTMVNQSGSVGDAGDQYTGLDRFGRVVDQRWIEGSGGSATDIDRYTYQFDRNSSRTARINQLDAAFSETYAFDGVDRLVDYARGGGGSGPQSQQWNLDALGNWTTITSDGTPESRTHNSQNELTGVGATPLAYDANGNMIQDEAGRQLQYNAWNRLVRVSLSGDQVAAYQYNGFQQRIVTTVGHGPSAIARDLFYSAGWQVLEQRIRTGGSLGSVAEEQFVWSVAYIDGLILRDRNADLNNATGAGGLEERVYALQDALWNTTALVDVNGNVLDRFAYTPYGVVETLNPNWTPSASSSIPWAVLFRGYFADEGTGLLHARARQYSPTLGRFVGRDPAGYLGGGYGLYGAYFVPNGLDYSGTVYIESETKTPHLPSPEPGKIRLGVTIPSLYITSDCQPCCIEMNSQGVPYATSWQLVLYEFKLEVLVFVTTKYPDSKADLPLDGNNQFTVENTRAHERIHARAFKQWHDYNEPKAKEDYNTGCIFTTENGCKIYAQMLDSKYQNSLNQLKIFEAAHVGGEW